MRRILTSTLLILLVAHIFIAQSDDTRIHSCGFDHLQEQVLSNSEAQRQFNQIKNRIRTNVELIKSQAQRDVEQANNYVIPVVIHVVGNGLAAAITDAQITEQIDILNNGFSNNLGSTFLVSDDAQITFCLAQNTPLNQPWTDFNSTMEGITRIGDADAITVSNNHNIEATAPNGQQALQNTISFPADQYLNIWIVNSISEIGTTNNAVLGYSPFPLSMGPPLQFIDGIVMRSDAFGLNSSHPLYNQGRTLIHEAGHYLGLLHTFQWGCEELDNEICCDMSGGQCCDISTCDTWGDECCDTPPTSVAFQEDCTVSVSASNNCIPGNVAMIENHMDYAFDNANTCRNTFTEDQADRMHATIQSFRANLVSFANLLATGVTCLPVGIDPTFITTEPGQSTQFCSGNLYGFNAAPGADTYSWTFQGASPSTSNLEDPSGISWPTPGAYTVTLTVSDGTIDLSSNLTVYVSDCTPIIGMNSHWYFGRECNVSFSTGNPTSVGNSEIITLETSASVSDEFGNLICYTNGQEIWDENGDVSPDIMNGTPNENVSISTRQGAVIIPRPGSPNYFIFTNSDQPVTSGDDGFGISMYEYDPSTNTLVDPLPIHPLENYATTEPIVAIPHANGVDFWIVVKTIHNLTQFGLENPGPVNNTETMIASYLVTQNGLEDVPILSSSGAYVVDPVPSSNGWIGNISVSPDKKYIAFSEAIFARLIHLYYFNAGNGFLEYITTLNGGFGLEFSPNSQLLYALSGQNIRQYDLSNINLCDPNPPSSDFTFVPIGTTPVIWAGDLQLGPDDKIYIARNGVPWNGPNGQSELAVINFPNNVNTNGVSNECGYNYNGVILDGNSRVVSDLPNDIIGFNGPNPIDFSFCSLNCEDVCFTNLGSGVLFEWDFGDGNILQGANGQIPAGTNDGQTTGNFEYPCHSYAIPGIYTVTLTLDATNQISYQVNVEGPVIPQITGPNPVCEGLTLASSYYGPSGFDYQWSSTTGQTGSNQNFDITWTALPADLTLEITDPVTGCSNINMITVEEEVCIPALEIDVHVFLEGALISPSFMHHILYDRELLPGMSFTDNQIGVETVAGQPYSGDPWSYNGTEGTNFNNSSYSPNIVDWVLLSLRTDIDESTEVARVAALVMFDGSILLVEDFPLTNVAGSFHIVIQHRNHLPVMSPLIDVVNGTLSYDFRIENSWTNGTSSGQKLHSTFDVWMMFGANGFQFDNNILFPQLDIQASDKTIWTEENGNFNEYLRSDYNLNGDVNGADKILWELNNGTFSVVPMSN